MNDTSSILDFFFTVARDDNQILTPSLVSSFIDTAQFPLTGVFVFYVPANLNQLFYGCFALNNKITFLAPKETTVATARRYSSWIVSVF